MSEFILEFLHGPGFLGTRANRAADVTLLAMILIAGLFTIGFYLARKRKYEAHRWVQTTAAILNVLLVLWMMILPFRDFILLDKGGPREQYFYWITTAHALTGMLAVIFGLFVVLRGNKLVPKFLRFRNYKPYMRTAYGLYMAATLLGVLVYLVWFVWTATPIDFLAR
jgi:uncharacterized membrane protein YozB (DUF420 family)